jgi:hypothetical protein
MAWVQLGGMLLGILGLVLLFLTPPVFWTLAWLNRRGRLPERWQRVLKVWPGRTTILGLVGLALGYGMMWAPSLVVGAKTDRAEKARRFE